ncbi:hypothetical protein ACIBCH_20750 [Amycolatopsis thailandensis]|uniref:hypothetical protein n=1 Tax=Amycolatopsis thailandensis TaxID=589330 RepID=UPI0037A28014
MTEPHYTIVKAVQTCAACPSQWDAWTDDGRYLYLRFRHGIGTVEEQPSPVVSTWTDEEPAVRFRHPDRDGVISLTEFAEHANLKLKLEAS